jgi:alpha-D-xyloside xylohydrolase
MISMMTWIRIYLQGILFFATTIGSAQTFQKTDLGLTVLIDSVKMEISFYSPSIVRIVKSPKDRFFTKESLSILKTAGPCQLMR